MERREIEIIMYVKVNEYLYHMLKKELLRKELLREKDINELLDLRDEKKFDEKWMEVYSQIDYQKDKIKNKKLIDDIRKEAFLKAYSLFESSDLAGYISDDFELISKGLEIEYYDKWLNGLFSCYLSNVFPCGEIRMVEEDLTSQIKRYYKNND